MDQFLEVTRIAFDVSEPMHQATFLHFLEDRLAVMELTSMNRYLEHSLAQFHQRSFKVSHAM